MDAAERIAKLKSTIDEAKNRKLVAETQLENAEKELAKIEEEMREFGVTPDSIDEEIKNKTEEIDNKLSEAEGIMKECHQKLQGL